MNAIKQFGVLVFHHGNTGEGLPLKRADNPEEHATFDNPAEAQKEMDERHIDYGLRTEIVDLDSSAIILQTTDEGRTWSAPTKGERLVTSVPA